MPLSILKMSKILSLVLIIILADSKLQIIFEISFIPVSFFLVNILAFPSPDPF
jgi:hypothetical protein